MDSFNSFFKESDELNIFRNCDTKANLDLLDITWMNMEAKCSTPRNQLSYFDSSLIYKCDIKDSIDELASNSENSIDFNDHPFVQINSNMDMKEEKLKDFVATAVDTLGTPTNFIPNETKVIKSHRSCDQFDLSKREDVLNKGAIRAIRKYYRDEFKQRYKSIIKKRICNCDYSDIITASEEFCRNLFPSSLCNEDLFCYMAGILKLCDVKNLNCSSYIKIEVGEFLNLVRSYSKIRFNQIFDSVSLRVICNHAINNNINPEKSYWLKRYLQSYESGNML